MNTFENQQQIQVTFLILTSFIIVLIFNFNNWLTKLEHRKNDGALLSNFGYSYDKVGNRLSMKDNLGLHTYTYDKLYRLRNVKYPAGKQVGYAYDPAGNRLQKTDGATTLPYAYDSANRLLSAGNVSYEYDNNGNVIKQTTPSGETAYTYDIENRPTLIKYPQAVGLPDTQFEYAPFGKRVMFCPFGKRIKKTDSTGTRYYLQLYIYGLPNLILMKLKNNEDD